MKLIIPEMSLVVLIGASGSGKSTFAKNHFLPTEIISSDYCRGLVSDDENNMDVTNPAFEILHFIAEKRLSYGKLTVIDATNVQSNSRKSIVDLAKNQDCMPVAIVLDLPEKLCQNRNKTRIDRQVPEHAIRNQCRQLRQSIKNLKNEGFRYIYVLKNEEEVEKAEIEIQKLWNNRKLDSGPFDIIGDVHGCFDELIDLVNKLGYSVSLIENKYIVSHPEKRKLLFLGDLGDRGPKIAETFRFVMDACEDGTALCVCGNHDAKLLRKLNKRDVQLTHGLDKTVLELKQQPPELSEKIKKFLDSLISHYVLDDGKLVVAHAGMKEKYQGRGSGRVREFALYGETTGENDEYGLPVRNDWTREYRGKALVVYGHIPVAVAKRQNNTICIDTGCVFGGSLTAYRYPEGDIFSEPAKETYYEPIRPFLGDVEKSDEDIREDDIPDIEDVIGKRILNTRLMKEVIVREENAVAALETMSRFAADPRWLIYLPPTMSPCTTSSLPDFLEYPSEAFSYFSSNGINKVVCEKKHMGSRAVVIICRSKEIAKTRFGVSDDAFGICYTRTGRRFFDEKTLEEEFIERIRVQLEKSAFFEDFKTNWVCLDCELMPWSAKAKALLEKQYAPTGIAGVQGLSAAVDALKSAAEREYSAFEIGVSVSGQNLDLNSLLSKTESRKQAMEKYIDAYRVYCWPTNGLSGIKLAPFHILAAENSVFVDRNHVWHMDTINKYFVGDDDLFMATPYLVVETENEESVKRGIDWWQKLTSGGGEGMVVKPYDFISAGKKGLLQPAVKCRGSEYLRIIYGPEYLLPENLPRLKSRSINKKSSLALREFSLGIESLERFVKNEPFYRVHECVFGVLAMESEPVDPRL